MPELEVTIDDVAAGGDGIGRAPDGRIVFVHGGIPGDRVAVEITQDRRTMLKGSVVDVVEPSPDRTGPPCIHVAEGCGGCTWQHVDIDAQRRFKARLVSEALRRIGGIDAPVEQGPPLPVDGYRTSARCLVTGDGVAFRTERGHEPVPIASCMVLHPGLDELVRTVRFGDATEVTLRIGAATGERLTVVDPAVGPGLSIPDDVTVVGADELAAGRRVWFHEEVAGRRFRVSARSFFQTRTDGAEALVAAVRDAGGDAWGSGRLADLYGGVGLFASTLGEGMTTVLVETGRSSVADAAHNLADRDARIVKVSVDRWTPSPADLVVADPPRAGLGRAAVTAVAATGAPRLVLVSCDAASFGRDAGLLAESGFSLHSTVLVDLFPHTPHVELVSRFEREGP